LVIIRYLPVVITKYLFTIEVYKTYNGIYLIIIHDRVYFDKMFELSPRRVGLNKNVQDDYQVKRWTDVWSGLARRANAQTKIFSLTPLFLTLKSFLSNWIFAVRCEDEISNLHPIKSDVPQGSFLSSTLHNIIYTADLQQTQHHNS